LTAPRKPENVVADFIAAMNQWERDSWKASRAARDHPDPSSYQEGVLESLQEIFNRCCTDRKRPQGRLGSFSKPPEYDPSTEAIVGMTEEGDRAVVETKREALLYDGTYRYTLHLTNGGWLIDRLQRLDDSGWESHVL
jgi:hypothetical protein